MAESTTQQEVVRHLGASPNAFAMLIALQANDPRVRQVIRSDGTGRPFEDGTTEMTLPPGMVKIIELLTLLWGAQCEDVAMRLTYERHVWTLFSTLPKEHADFLLLVAGGLGLDPHVAMETAFHPDYTKQRRHDDNLTTGVAQMYNHRTKESISAAEHMRREQDGEDLREFELLSDSEDENADMRFHLHAKDHPVRDVRERMIALGSFPVPIKIPNGDIRRCWITARAGVDLEALSRAGNTELVELLKRYDLFLCPPALNEYDGQDLQMVYYLSLIHI